MGKRGPKPVPTPVLAQRGSWRAQTRRDEPKPAHAMPSCPAWVSADARKYWKEIGGVLDGMKVLTGAGHVALGLLVDALSRYVAAKRAVYGTTQEQGIDFTTVMGPARSRYPIALLMHETWSKCSGPVGSSSSRRVPTPGCV